MRKIKKLRKQFVEWAKSHKFSYIIIMFSMIMILEMILLLISEICEFNIWIEAPFVFVTMLALFIRIFIIDLDFILSAPKNYKDIKRI